MGSEQRVAYNDAMRITILTIGSRGDVQPYVALGHGLQQAGYRVRLATHEPFRDLVTQHGLDFAAVGGNPREMLETAAGRGWIDSNQNPLQFIRYFIELTMPRLEQGLEDSWAAGQGSDAIIYSLLGNAGFHVAEKLGVPGILALLQPFTPTRAFPAVGVPPALWLGGRSNWISHKVTEQVLWQPFRGLVNRWRRERLDLPPLPLRGPYHRIYAADAPILCGYSPAVLPKPADWPANVHVTGYWFLEQAAGWRPSPALEAFLAAEPRPLYVGFGSMTDAQPQQLLATVLAALARSGQRAVLHSGWADLERADLPPSVLPVGFVPHDWLFPRVAAVVHHGGAGTTAAGLRAGVPSLLVPFFADQHFWGEHVKHLGVGPQPIPRQALTADKLTSAINQAVHNRTMRARAAALGRQIRSEDGVGRAVALIDGFLRP